MIITINLLPNTDKEKQHIARLNARILAASLLCLAIAITGCALLFIYRATLNADLQSINAEITSTEQKISTYKNIAEMAQLVDSSLTDIETLENSGISWVNLLDYLSNLTPQEIQITSLKISALPSPTLAISGHSSTRREALKFFEKLKASSSFTDVTLGSLSETENQETSVFTVTSSIKQGSPQ